MTRLVYWLEPSRRARRTTPVQLSLRTPYQRTTHRCVLLLLGAAFMLKFWKDLAGPCPHPYQPTTYLPYLWGTKKEIIGWVKVGYNPLVLRSTRVPPC